MTLSAHRPSLTLVALLLLLGGLPGRSYAEYGILEISRTRVKELGITVSAGPSALKYRRPRRVFLYGRPLSSRLSPSVR